MRAIIAGVPLAFLLLFHCGEDLLVRLVLANYGTTASTIMSIRSIFS
jgi:hypothetical protein